MASTTNTSSPIIKLALVGIVAIGLYYVSEGVKQGAQWIKALPVEGTMFSAGATASPKAAGSSRTTPATIHPLVIASMEKSVQGEASGPEEVEMVTLDKLFGRVVPVSSGSNKTPDLTNAYLEQMKQARVQSVTNQGAVINNHFFSPGEKVWSAGFRDSEGVFQAPTLISLTTKGVRLGDPKNRALQVTLPLL